MTVGQDDIETKLSALREDYLARLPAKVAEIEAVAGKAGGDPSSGGGQDALRAIQHLAHNLAGSGGTFGLPAVGTAAEDVERACEALLEAPSADGWENLLTLIRTLRGEVAAIPENG